MKHNHIIGLLCNMDYQELITLPELEEHIKKEQDSYEYAIKHFPVVFHSLEPYTLKDYCDKRRSTNLTRFDYCPVCGEKIEWSKFRKGREEK